jgi:hypothetical protein
MPLVLLVLDKVFFNNFPLKFNGRYTRFMIHHCCCFLRVIYNVQKLIFCLIVMAPPATYRHFHLHGVNTFIIRIFCCQIPLQL